jgi:hypothetical protein
MSTFNDIQVIGKFYGVTENKGDLIVNDGTKNTPLPVGLNNYVLTADSTQPLGIKWAPSQGAAIYNTQYVLNASPVATNSISPVPIDAFTSTFSIGSYVVLVDLTFSMSKFNRSASFGLYKNGILIPNSTRAVDPFQAFFNTTISLSALIAFNDADIFTVRMNTSNLDTDIILHAGSAVIIKLLNVTQYATSGENFTTNYTLPITISNTINTPTPGVYLVLFNCTFYTTLNRRTVTFGMYKDNVLISGTSRTIDTVSKLKYSYEVHHVVSFVGSEIFTMKVNTSNLDVDIVISNRTLIFIAL